MNSLTNGLTNIAGSDVQDISIGPFTSISTILDKFGLSFSFLDEFFDMFDSLGTLETDLPLDLKQLSLPRMPAFFELGSKQPAKKYPVEVYGLLWDKLVDKFPNSTYNGVQLPGIDIGFSFVDAFPSRSGFPGDLPVEKFLRLIAVAYGYAKTFADAGDFTLDKLFTPSFGPAITAKLLNILQSNEMFDFSRFAAEDSLGFPFDPDSRETFSIEKYLPQILVVLDLAPGIEFVPSNFNPTHLLAAIFKSSKPTVTVSELLLYCGL